MKSLLDLFKLPFDCTSSSNYVISCIKLAKSLTSFYSTDLSYFLDHIGSRAQMNIKPMTMTPATASFIKREILIAK